MHMQIIKLKNYMTGGNNISWATPEYIESIISSKNPDLTKCELIKDIQPKTNEGRHNDGIGFVEIEGKEYFLKYGLDLFNEFKTGYLLSKLKSEYPYFLNVYSLFKCDYIPRGKTESVNGQVMVAEKGGETIYTYLNRKTREYILNLIPDLEARVNQLDDNINRIINETLTEEEKELDNWRLRDTNKEKYDSIILQVEGLVKEFYLSLSKEIIQFQTEFVPLFLKNYKILIDSNMIVDIFTINKYNSFISDKKSDNFMVTTEPYIEGKNHINIKIGTKDIRIKNVCEWHNSKEYCFVYPVDFGSGGNMDYSKLPGVLASYYYNQWIYFFSRFRLYSDNHDNNLESGNILSLNGTNVEIKLSKFSSYNKLSKLYFTEIFQKYNPFKINIFMPLDIYFNGMSHMIKNTDEELNRLLQENPLGDNDFRFQMITKKFYEIKSFEEAIEILQILLNGNTVTYDDYHKHYRAFSSGIGFEEANGLSKDYSYLSDENVYKTFEVILE